MLIMMRRRTIICMDHNDRANQIIDAFDSVPAVEAEPMVPNNPLTLDELREMAERCDGIYVTRTDGRPLFRDQNYCAAVLDLRPSFGSMSMQIQAIYGDKLTLWEDEYGKTWLAYRRKPEEE